MSTQYLNFGLSSELFLALKSLAWNRENYLNTNVRKSKSNNFCETLYCTDIFDSSILCTMSHCVTPPPATNTSRFTVAMASASLMWAQSCDYFAMVPSWLITSMLCQGYERVLLHIPLSSISFPPVHTIPPILYTYFSNICYCFPLNKRINFVNLPRSNVVPKWRHWMEKYMQFSWSLNK
jgi:hypothetical protein